MTIFRFVSALIFIVTSSSAVCSTVERSASIVEVSMIHLLTDPNTYAELEGYISTVGFLSVDGRTLFLTANHAKLNDISSSVFVSPPSDHYLNSTCLGQFVRISGRFTISSASDLRLKDITLVQEHDEEWITKDCWKATGSDN